MYSSGETFCLCSAALFFVDEDSSINKLCYIQVWVVHPVGSQLGIVRETYFMNGKMEFPTTLFLPLLWCPLLPYSDSVCRISNNRTLSLYALQILCILLFTDKWISITTDRVSNFNVSLQCMCLVERLVMESDKSFNFYPLYSSWLGKFHKYFIYIFL